MHKSTNNFKTYSIKFYYFSTEDNKYSKAIPNFTLTVNDGLLYKQITVQFTILEICSKENSISECYRRPNIDIIYIATLS